MFSANFLILSALVAACGFVHAAPQGNPNPGSNPSLVTVRYCNQAAFKGAQCTLTEVEPGRCVAVVAAHNNKVASFKAAYGQHCELFDNSDCTGQSLSIHGPDGVSDLSTQNFGNKLSSFKCTLN